MDDNQAHPGADWVLQPLTDGEWWNVVESNAALSATAIHRKPARSLSLEEESRGFFDGRPEGAPVRAAAEGHPEQDLGCEVQRQGN